jgi:hypothetical protein
MIDKQHEVASVDQLLPALADRSAHSIALGADLAKVPGFRLSPGQRLLDNGRSIRFAAGQDGVQLSADNELTGLSLIADPQHCAVFNDTAREHLGLMQLRDLRVGGCVRLLARDKVRGGHVEAHGIDVIAGDVRTFGQRPKGYGVEVVAGAFTLWNQQSDPVVTITA